MNSLHAAQAFLDQTFPNCDAAFLAGSVTRGEGTPASDLDIVVITKGNQYPYEESLHAFGWPIDVIFNSPETCRKLFQMDRQRRRPAIAHMCAEGIILKDCEGLATQLKHEAKQIMQEGPRPLSDEDLTRYRLQLTDVLEDFENSLSEDECLLMAQNITFHSFDIILARNGQWLGEGKWLLRALRDFNPSLAQQSLDALRLYYQQGIKDDLISFGDQVLNEVGGRLKEGLHSPKRREIQPTASAQSA
jgi:Nucleotidyltransferase domain